MDIGLPFNKQPIIDSYSYHANIVAIISQYEDLEPWIYGRFLRLAYCKDNNYLDFCDGDYFDYYRCRTMYANGSRYLAEYRNYPFLECIDMTGECASQELVPLLTACMNDGYYAIIHLDHYFIAATDVYGISHKNHECIVYGYNLDKQVFYAADNFVSGKYVSIEIGFAEMEKARRASEERELKRAMKVRVAEDRQEEGININGIIKKLQEYASGTDSSMYGIITGFSEEGGFIHNGFQYDWHWYEHADRQAFIYGVDIYSFFIDDLREVGANRSKIDLRRYHTMYNHKVVLCKLYHYLTSKSFMQVNRQLETQLNELAKQCILLQNIVLKYNVTRDIKLLDVLMKYHEQSIQQEQAMVQQFVGGLERSGSRCLFV
ncbi:hypothetical protein DFQ01_10337 [Paenibacillus cellulosilyticus]|uniref:Butirosin biosynthesis protein H-like n=2 Tax=Paenibacillus cellulosilyticus TaxID=375489 RepID=A0A2V2YXF8_9BACL|nr:hypothetical protein DFQ01_10337 [Paenibacillus cellulosilyticus]